MLLIRSDQMAVFRKHLRGKFEDRLLAHLHRQYPEKCAEKGIESVKAAIARGVDSAFSYGVGSEAHVTGYVEIMYQLSEDFDTRFQWASEVLKSKMLKPADKMANLHQRVAHYLKANA